MTIVSENYMTIVSEFTTETGNDSLFKFVPPDNIVGFATKTDNKDET